MLIAIAVVVVAVNLGIGLKHHIQWLVWGAPVWVLLGSVLFAIDSRRMRRRESKDRIEPR